MGTAHGLPECLSGRRPFVKHAIQRIEQRIRVAHRLPGGNRLLSQALAVTGGQVALGRRAGSGKLLEGLGAAQPHADTLAQ